MLPLRATARVFREEVPKHPVNARFFSNSVLLEIVEGKTPPSSSESRRRAMAELAVRFFLNPTGGRDKAAVAEMSRIGKLIREWIGSEELATFVQACDEVCRRDRAPGERLKGILTSLIRHLSRLSAGDASAVIEAFRPWLEADGVIPVFNAECTAFIPFVFTKETQSASDVVVRDWRGNPLKEWTGYLRELSEQNGLNCDVQVAVEETNFISATGDSLMLPLQMAWWRRQGELPLYNRIRFVATGSFHGGMIGTVEVGPKLQAITAIRDGRLIYPGDGRSPNTLFAGDRQDGVLDDLRRYAEEDYEVQPEYSAKRLADLEARAHGRNVEEWTGLIKRLDHLQESLDECLDADAYLDCLMLRSSANCHAGNTETSRALNTAAMAIAARKDTWLSRSLRLRIEQLVILQDGEDFERIFALEKGLLSDLQAFDEKENHSVRATDLLMRYHGTMGQFTACVALRDGADCVAKVSYDHFRKAFDFACELNGRISGIGKREQVTALDDCTRDANYLLLWAALFNHADVTEAAKRACSYARRLADVGAEEGSTNNSLYRNRYCALAQYRAVLKGTVKPDILGLPTDFSEVGWPWLRATCSKYLGAVAAVEGHWDDAVALFKTATEAMSNYTSGLFVVIRMTVMSEAYRSLRRNAGTKKLALDYRQQALDLFETHADDAQLSAKAAWRDWLASEGRDENFPGLYYWY